MYLGLWEGVPWLQKAGSGGLWHLRGSLSAGGSFAAVLGAGPCMALQAWWKPRREVHTASRAAWPMGGLLWGRAESVARAGDTWVLGTQL